MAKTNTKPNSFMADWEDADHLILLESWARDGYTVQDIATRIGITTSMLRVWMGKSEEIKKAINTGRELVDYKVENALLKAALGYKTKETRVCTIIKNGRTIETQKETIEREQAPNVSACQTWLYNRRSDKWKPQNKMGGVLDNIDEDTSIHITVERAGATEGRNNQQASSAIDEVDTDWQNDVNKSVTIRGMSPEEKEQAKREKKKAKKQQQEEEENSWIEYDDDETPNQSSKASGAKGSGSGKSTQQGVNTTDVDDLDYWPDDWEDDDEQEG